MIEGERGDGDGEDGAAGVKEEGGDRGGLVVWLVTPKQERAGREVSEGGGLQKGEGAGVFVQERAGGAVGGAEIQARLAREGGRGDAEEDGGEGGDKLGGAGWERDAGQRGGEAVCEEDGGEQRQRWVKGRDVVREASLHEGEEDQGKERKRGPGAEIAAAAEGCGESKGIEQGEGGGGDEQDPKVIPGVGVVAFDGLGGAGDDVEADEIREEGAAEAMEHEERPGKDEGEERGEAEPEGPGEADGFREEQGSEGERRGGGPLGEYGGGEGDPEDVPADGLCAAGATRARRGRPSR